MEIIDGEKFKEVKTLEVTTSTPVDEFQKKACKRFCKWEDWRFGLYSVQNKAWMTQGTMGDYGLEPMVSLSPLFLIGVCHDINPCQLQSVLHLKPRTADFFDDQEEHEEPQKKLKASTSSLSFNLFSRTVMETKVSTPFYPSMLPLKFTSFPRWHAEAQEGGDLPRVHPVQQKRRDNAGKSDAALVHRGKGGG